MPEVFDPYHKWLGIAPKDQPPDCYRLLGIDLFEDDPEVIQAAAERQMGHVRKYQLGQHSQTSQKILNEIAAAKLRLLKPDQRQAYDAQLRRELAAKAMPPPIPGPGKEVAVLRRPSRSSVAPGVLAGKCFVALGLALVLVSRGCHALGDRAADRARARLGLFEEQLQEEPDDARLSPPIKQLRDSAESQSLGSADIDGAIEEAGDLDTFSFTAPASGRLEISLSAPDGTLDGLVKVYDRDKKLLQEDDDGAGNRNARLVMDVTAGERYLVEVSASRNAGTTSLHATGSYRLRLAIQSSLDDFDDSLDMAHTVTLVASEADEEQFQQWMELDRAARETAHHSALQAYWAEWLFLLGSVGLAVGLLVVAFLGQGPERWISLAMVSLILFSLYVGGVGWAGRTPEAPPTAQGGP